VMEHIEEAGIHSGDSACSLPPYTLPPATVTELKAETEAMAKALGVVGLMNVQYAIKDDVIFVLEVNPRASRTVPFVAKATGVPFARLATRLCLGESLREVGLTEEPPLTGFSIKAPVFPFRRFEGVDTILGPEMLSTGEVMGHDKSFGLAFLKAALGAGIRLPENGTAFLSVHDGDKEAILPIARELASLGFSLIASSGTAKALRAGGLTATTVLKVNEGRPNIVDKLINGEVALIVNTPLGRESFYDEVAIRRTALERDIPCLTTLSAASAAIEAIRARAAGALSFAPLQEEVRV
jgi:carbamoyl-phosphate synthase large subunit